MKRFHGHGAAAGHAAGRMAFPHLGELLVSGGVLPADAVGAHGAHVGQSVSAGQALLMLVPTETYDKEAYIREDEVWQTIRELAEWTLMRITEQSIPEDVEFSLN